MLYEVITTVANISGSGMPWKNKKKKTRTKGAWKPDLTSRAWRMNKQEPAKGFYYQNSGTCRARRGLWNLRIWRTPVSSHSLQFEHYPCSLKAQVDFISKLENPLDANIAVPVIHKIVAPLHGFETQGEEPLVDLRRANSFTTEPDHKIGFSYNFV